MLIANISRTKAVFVSRAQGDAQQKEFTETSENEYYCTTESARQMGSVVIRSDESRWPKSPEDWILKPTKLKFVNSDAGAVPGNSTSC